MKALTSIVVSFLVLVGFANSAQANDFAFAAGYRLSNADGDKGGSVDAQAGFGLGVLGFFDLTDKIQGRVGFLFNQRNIDVDFKSQRVYGMRASYIDIPVTAMYKFADYGGAFAGPVLGLLASGSCKDVGSAADCSGLEKQKSESNLMGFQFGASFKFAPQMGGEIYYEKMLGTFWKNIASDLTTVGLNFLLTFE